MPPKAAKVPAVERVRSRRRAHVLEIGARVAFVRARVSGVEDESLFVVPIAI